MVKGFNSCLLLIDDDEIDYVGVLNRALPDDIRILGWCPVPRGFSARCVSFSSDLSLSF